MENKNPNNENSNATASPEKETSASKEHNSSGGPVERKNFMKPQFENPLEKREKFAVNLRKKKTQEIVKAKRRKIIESIHSKSKGQVIGLNNGQQIQEESKEDVEISVEEMEEQIYTGYPLWRKNKFSEQIELLDKMGTPDDWKTYESSGITQRVQYLLNLLIQEQNEATQQLAILTKIRQELANGKLTPQITELVTQTNILKIINQILGVEEENANDLTRYLKLEATWILTNLAYGSEEDLLIVLDAQHGIVNHLNRIMEGNDLQMIDQAIWFISNVCGESLNLRNLMLTQTNIVKGLTRIISDAQRMNASIRKGLLKSIVWCVCNICRAKKENFNSNQQAQPNGNQMHALSLQEQQQLLYIITTFIDCKEMSRAMIDAVWALAYLAENAEDNFITQICQSQSLIDAIITNLNSQLMEEQIPALRATGNILATSNQENVDIFIFHKGLDSLSNILQDAMKNYQYYPAKVMKEILWCLSNVTAGSTENIESVFSHQSLPAQIFKCMTSQNIEIRREATYTVTNAIGSTDSPKILYFIYCYDNYAIIKLFINCLKMNDANIIIEIISALNDLIKLDKSVPLQGNDQVAYKFEVEGGLDELEQLQKHPNIKVYQEVEKFISMNFESEPDDMMFQGNQQNTFQDQNVNINNRQGVQNRELQQQQEDTDSNMFQI